MIIDFSKISKTVKQLDHRNLNEILPKGINPTAENIAHWIAQEVQKEINKEEANYLSAPNKMPPEEALPKVSKVTVQESEGNIACYTP
jgi:6-pyruvoyl-tetrahydropterin synthase